MTPRLCLFLSVEVFDIVCVMSSVSQGCRIAQVTSGTHGVLCLFGGSPVCRDTWYIFVCDPRNIWHCLCDVCCDTGLQNSSSDLRYHGVFWCSECDRINVRHGICLCMILEMFGSVCVMVRVSQVYG